MEELGKLTSWRALTAARRYHDRQGRRGAPCRGTVVVREQCMSSSLCQKPGGQTIPEDERVQSAGILHGVVSRQYPVGWLESPAAMPPENCRQVSASLGGLCIKIESTVLSRCT